MSCLIVSFIYYPMIYIYFRIVLKIIGKFIVYTVKRFLLLDVDGRIVFKRGREIKFIDTVRNISERYIFLKFVI